MWKIILFRIIHARNQITKLFVEPCPFLEKYTQNKTLINYCQLYIDYESNKHILKIKKKKKSKYFSHHLQLKAYNVLLHPKFKVNFSTLETQTGLKYTCPTALYLSFQFHNNNSIIISMSENWVALTTCFKNDEILYTSVEFGGWPFSMTVTRYFRPKSDHSNERVYREPIEKRLKKLPNEGRTAFYD